MMLEIRKYLLVMYPFMRSGIVKIVPDAKNITEHASMSNIKSPMFGGGGYAHVGSISIN